MHVVATAGHVDHGKSTLIQALTGMDPDRLAEEKRRGVTLDLGFAWTTLPDGPTIAFVDVPGHERFVGTMLAGVGEVPAVLVVVAADEGWRAQTAEHITILDSLQTRHALLAVTRSDLADPRPVLREAQDRLSRTSLRNVEAVAVSAVTGQGMTELRAALARLVAGLPEPRTDGRVRLFVDRAFTIRGSGTVVAGTLRSGRLRPGDRLQVSSTGEEARIRGLQSLGAPVEEANAVARVAINLRGMPLKRVHRGTALVTPGAWALTNTFDARFASLDPRDIPGDLVLHVGSAASPCRLRPLGEDTARVTIAHKLPLEPGDIAVVRDPSRRLVTGIHILDVDPPALRRRGAAGRRAHELDAMEDRPDVVREIARRRTVTRAHLAAVGVLSDGDPLPASIRSVGDYLVEADTWSDLSGRLLDLVDEYRARNPIDAGVSMEGARRQLRLPDIALVEELVRESDGQLRTGHGRIARPGTGPMFTEGVQQALRAIVDQLEADPFAAPEAPDLAAAGLDSSTLAAAAHAGMFLRLTGDVLLHESAPRLAVERIATITAPFTLSEARQAIGTTRRIAVPLLEHLDSTGGTVRIDSTRRNLRAAVPTTR